MLHRGQSTGSPPSHGLEGHRPQCPAEHKELTALWGFEMEEAS